MHKSVVHDVMSTNVASVSAATPFKQLVTVLRNGQASAVVVVDETGRPHGVVTPADMIVKETDPHGYGPRAMGPYRGRELKKATAATAGELMSAPPVTGHSRIPRSPRRHR